LGSAAAMPSVQKHDAKSTASRRTSSPA
jgi:hypothetical protein